MKEVEKIWGKEFWVVNEEQYCGKILELKEGFISSYHKHLTKDETFLVTEGRVLLKLEGEEYILQKDSVVHVGPGDFHSFEGITDAKITEFSTHHDDADVIRQTESHKIEKELKKTEEEKPEEQKEPEKEEPKEEIEQPNVTAKEPLEKKPEETEAIQKGLETTETVVEDKIKGEENGNEKSKPTNDIKEQ